VIALAMPAYRIIAVVKTSVIVTTYNWKEALELVLRSFARQSRAPDELIIADDGSRPDTGELVRSWTARMPMPLVHLWQEDDGFRVARSRNRAIAACRGDYVILLDGDMVAHRDFVADHARAARRGYFIQGSRLVTGPAAGARMLREGLLDLPFWARDIQRRRHAIRNRMLSWLVYQHVRTDQDSIRSCNQGYWRDDLLRVNGFNERMVGWGREDNDIAARLYHVGVRRRQLKFAGLATHLYHNQRKPPGDNPNDVILRATIAGRLTRCEAGIDQHFGEFPQG
jgi:glycosyltransferase involved in cell wall biosynthesis